MKNLFLFIPFFFLLSNHPVVYADEPLKIYAPPSIWAQQDGQMLTGPIIDLVVELFDEFNIRVETQILPWARAIDQMKSGELDLIPVIFHTDERAKFMEFTIPYVDVPTAVFVPPGKSFQFNTLDDLRNRRGLMVREDSISAEFKSFEPKLNIVKVTDYEQIFNMLGGNRADYAVAAKYGFIIHAKKLGYEDRIELLPDPVATRNLHFAFSKKSKFLTFLPVINEKLKQQKMDGCMEKMVKKAIHLASER
jgi:polar amino acid transport system substrate-binding protein